MIASETLVALIAMKRLVALSLLLLSLLGSANGVWAQGYWRDLPPEDRRQLRQQMREHWQQEREIRRDDGASRWRDVPQEDRRRLRGARRIARRPARDKAWDGRASGKMPAHADPRP